MPFDVSGWYLIGVQYNQSVKQAIGNISGVTIKAACVAIPANVNGIEYNIEGNFTLIDASDVQLDYVNMHANHPSRNNADGNDVVNGSQAFGNSHWGSIPFDMSLSGWEPKTVSIGVWVLLDINIGSTITLTESNTPPSDELGNPTIDPSSNYTTFTLSIINKSPSSLGLPSGIDYGDWTVGSISLSLNNTSSGGYVDWAHNYKRFLIGQAPYWSGNTNKLPETSNDMVLFSNTLVNIQDISYTLDNLMIEPFIYALVRKHPFDNVGTNTPTISSNTQEQKLGNRIGIISPDGNSIMYITNDYINIK